MRSLNSERLSRISLSVSLFLSLSLSHVLRLRDACCSCESAPARQINTEHYLPRYQVPANAGRPLFSIGRVKTQHWVLGNTSAPLKTHSLRSAPSPSHVQINTHRLDVIQPFPGTLALISRRSHTSSKLSPPVVAVAPGNRQTMERGNIPKR